ncbi:hypothetical protein MRB53_035820 [Persea americana]|uniref:Uncharacterized protein n=1 Tax=Persea americana TaxID=3435 RepID=A0ACC2K5P5_PERAE|nr:hypothetical protein MRB53_035820 [Persea americana]
MASSPFCCVFIFCILQTVSGSGPYRSILSFGDSFADTGNFLISVPSYTFLAKLPYGQTYFGHPTGRFSDGRLIVDFIAEAYGLPNLPPYLASLHQHRVDSQQGVNFAVAGATALDPAFFQEGNVTTKVRSNDSLSVQMGWFEQFKSSLCQTTQECTDYLGKSLFLLGEIGGNDYDYSLFQGLSIAQVRTFVPKVVQAISAATSRLIEQGAVDLVVPGIPPIGCFPYHLTIFSSPKKEDYDPRNGCLKALNGFSEYHNSVLQTALEKLRKKNPQANIVYADFYGAAMRFFHSPKHFGFTNVHSACCGQGGRYNFNGSALCGAPGSTVCVDPSTFISWDGIHLTEAASRIIANGMLQGLYTTPPMTLPHQEFNHGL